MLNERVSAMPDSYEVAPEAVARARRRRTTRLTALVAIVAAVAIGTTAAVAQLVNRDSPDRVATSSVTSTSTARPGDRPSVPTVVCPIEYSLTGSPLPSPSLAPRVPPAGDPQVLRHFVSFAATTDPRYTVLGPTGWSCRTTIAADGNNGMAVYDSPKPNHSLKEGAAITIENDFLWHGGVGSVIACSVFDDPALVAYLTQNFAVLASHCPSAGRTVTRINQHTATFVDTDGTRGAGWIVLPSSDAADDGQISVLQCRPTVGLTVADCDTIIADFVARMGKVPLGPTNAPTTSTATPPTTTTTPHSIQIAPGTISAPPFSPLSWAATDRGMVISNYDGSSALAAYDASGDSWVTLPALPFSSRPTVLAARGNRVFVVGQATDTDATTAFAAIDTTTGQWHELARVPEPVSTLVSTPTNLPAGVWTGHEMVVFSCRSSAQATDAAAFDPATNQ
jgi:hypothetical protein